MRELGGGVPLRTSAQHSAGLVRCLARALYAKLFLFVIMAINELAAEEAGDAAMEIGLIDVFGVEKQVPHTHARTSDRGRVLLYVSHLNSRGLLCRVLAFHVGCCAVCVRVRVRVLAEPRADPSRPVDQLHQRENLRFVQRANVRAVCLRPRRVRARCQTRVLGVMVLLGVPLRVFGVSLCEFHARLSVCLSGLCTGRAACTAKKAC
jgi:hypothetical protein